MATPVPVGGSARRASGSTKMTALLVKPAAPGAVATPTGGVLRRRNSRAASRSGEAASRNGPSGAAAAPTSPTTTADTTTQRRRRKCRVTVDVSSCRYAIVRKCLRERDFRLVKRTPSESTGAALLPAKWDIWWSDRGDLLRELPRLSPFQKVNHFPSMEEICRKDFLANNLNAIYKVLPSEFEFFPRTFLIPAETVELKSAMENGPKNATYIVKPRTLCQGKGISLIQSYAKLPANEPCVVQRYIDNPLLIDGLKFDLRIYVLVYSVNPLKIYIFRNGLARFCTTPFQKPTKKNLSKKRMHLTNYAINKRSKDFQQATTSKGENQASKRSLASIMKHLDESGRCSSINVWNQICDIVVKTLLCIEPKLQSSYKSFFGANEAVEAQWGPKCFEILGFDVMLDAAGKVWLFEVNHAPSFAGDSPLDKEIKIALISGALEVVGVTNEKKRQYVSQQRAEWAKRLWVTTQVQSRQPVDDKRSDLPPNELTNVPLKQRPHETRLTSDDAPENTDESDDSETEEGNNEVGLDEDPVEDSSLAKSKHEGLSLKNVLLRRNRVNPTNADESEVSAFRNEFAALYPMALPNRVDEHIGLGFSNHIVYRYDKVRAAAQVNKSKLWS